MRDDSSDYSRREGSSGSSGSGRSEGRKVGRGVGQKFRSCWVSRSEGTRLLVITAHVHSVNSGHNCTSCLDGPGSEGEGWGTVRQVGRIRTRATWFREESRLNLGGSGNNLVRRGFCVEGGDSRQNYRVLGARSHEQCYDTDITPRQFARTVLRTGDDDDGCLDRGGGGRRAPWRARGRPWHASIRYGTASLHGPNSRLERSRSLRELEGPLGGPLGLEGGLEGTLEGGLGDK